LELARDKEVLEMVKMVRFKEWKQLFSYLKKEKEADVFWIFSLMLRR